MSFKNWVIRRRALRSASEAESNGVPTENCLEAVLSVVSFLHTQCAQTGDLRLVLKTGEANIKALGYIYGFTDAAFQTAGVDIGSEPGAKALVAIISEFDRSNAEILCHRLKVPGDPLALMEGVKIGFDDYCRLSQSKTASDNFTPGWAECFAALGSK